jgi:hypothetical protein
MSNRLSNWLSVASNVAVLVGIFFIVVELRQNRALMRAQITQARADNVTARYAQQSDSDYWPAIQAKRRAAGGDISRWVESLTPEEFERVRYYALTEFNDIRNQFYQYQQGFLDEAIWDTSTRGQVERLLPLVPVFLGTVQRLDPEFKAMLDQIAEEAGLPRVEDGSTSSM